MPDIVLATLNAKYIHASFGLRCLMANLGDLSERACMCEFVIHQQPLEIVEAVLARQPRIVGFGVYIWNVEQTTAVVALLKRIRPDLIIILGGPEVSHETEGQGIVALADHIITGEADVKFAEVCRVLLAGGSLPDKVMAADLPALPALASPYELYTEEDLTQRVVYVEASRGCPFTCEFCLSSLDQPVRAFPLDSFLAAMQRMLDRGATQFKFVDRTFNLHLPTSTGILQFFLDRWREGLFLHFEMIPDRLPEQLRSLIRRFPPGAVQFEVGIQTFDESTSKNISRRQNLERLEANFRFLREETGVHIHADLIVGLPGEGIESFGRGFDRLVRLGPQEIQVGILKRLRGTPIVRHDAEHGMLYAPHPPYEILRTKEISFNEMQRMRRFARYWDLVANSGHFTTALRLLWQETGSPFEEFMRFSDWIYGRLGRTHQIALRVMAQCLFEFLVEESACDRDVVAKTLEADWQRTPGRGALNLRGLASVSKSSTKRASQRQARHSLTAVNRFDRSIGSSSTSAD
ncbi:MAG: DUF4080 domain-containing protein [Prosthecobacter sp.]